MQYIWNTTEFDLVCKVRNHVTSTDICGFAIPERCAKATRLAPPRWPCPQDGLTPGCAAPAASCRLRFLLSFCDYWTTGPLLEGGSVKR